MSLRTIRIVFVLLALCSVSAEYVWGRTGSIWVDYPANNTLINKQSGSFDAGIGFTVNLPSSGIIQTGIYCGPGYPVDNPDPRWYGLIEQTDYLNDAYPGSIIASLKYSIDNGSSSNVADVRIGDNQDKIAAINVMSLTDNSHNATFNMYGVYAERCAYPEPYCSVCHGNTYATSPWVRKEGAAFAQAALGFRVMSPIAGAPTLTSPAHRTFVAPSWVGSDSVNLVWSAVTNATKYTLNLTDGGSLNKTIETGATSFNTGSDSSISLQRAHKYSWTVTAANDLGWGTPATAKQFIVGAADCWPEVGTGTGQSHIDTCYDLNSNPEVYRLKDISRRTNMDIDGHKGDMGSANAIITQVSSATAGALTNSSDSWTTAGSQKKAIDAHDNTAKVYDYFYDPLLNPLLDRVTTPRRFSRNSFDDSGSSMVNIVEISSGICGSATACFNPPDKSVNFVIGGTSASAQDIVTHEWAHGITGSTSKLAYSKETGALHEAFSDWMAIAHKQARGDNSWRIIRGDGSLLRDLADPTLSNPAQPVIYQKKDTWTNDYKDTPNWGETDSCTPDPIINDYCWVHYNSGVPNRMFSLLASGGRNYEVEVQGVGIARAMQIAFKSNTEKWSLKDTVTFGKARDEMVDAVKELSATPSEINQINLAWAAVGVGDLPKIATSTPDPQSGITAAYRENDRLPACTPANDVCILDKRYQSTCCSYEEYHSPWDTRVAVKATPNPGYYFNNWTANGDIISSSPAYTFNVTGDSTLVANFTSIAPTVAASYSGDFQSVATSSSSPEHTFIVFNSGAQSITFTPVQLAGANLADFSITANGCSGQLAPAASCMIKARFSPATAGNKTASLIIPSTGSTSPTYVIPLSGQAGMSVMTSAASSLEGIGFASIQSAYNSVTNGNELKLMATNFNESLNFNRSVNTTLRGGYNGNFIDTAGKSVLQGALTISSGTVIVDGLQIGGSSYQSALSVAVNTPASGTVSSTPSGINCSSNCSSSFINGDQVTLTASPAGDATFIGWSGGGCSGTGSCTVTMTGDMAVTALFSAAKIYVVPSSESLGSVYAGTATSPQTITVSSSGSHDLILGTLSLTGTDTAEFIASGDTCSGRTLAPTATCTVQVVFSPASTGAKTASILFSSNDPQTPVFSVSLNGIGTLPTISIAKTGNGFGTVTSSPAGINCGNSCTAAYTLNSTVALTANPDFGYSFSGWSGACSGTGSCNLIMSSDYSVTATFIEIPIAACSANPTFVNGSVYPSIQAAYNAAPDGSSIKLLATDIYENFVANRGIDVTIDGGYKCSFTSNAYETALHGEPDIRTGTVVLENISVVE